MRGLLKKVSGKFLIPFFKWYLKKERDYKLQDITVKVLPGVFHPGYFHSTGFLIEHLRTFYLKNQRLLELGCGTGLISIFAASRGALVTASDVSKTAVENTRLNVSNIGATIDVVESDLFEAIEGSFDLIVINPPYYAKEVRREHDLAWNCGPNFEYFKKLFSQLSKHISSSSVVIMVLTKGCDIERIKQIATSSDFALKLVKEQSRLFDEKDYLFEITVNSTASIQA